jgi:membrane protease YdiL (CAAX protease family)
MTGLPATEMGAAPSPPARDRAPWGWRDFAWVLFITIAALVAIFTTLAFVVAALDIDEPESNPIGATLLLVGQLLLDGAAVGAAWAFSIAKYGLSWRAWALMWPPQLNVGRILLTLFLCFAALAAYRGITVGLGLEALQPESNVPRELFEDRRVVPLTLFLILVVAPLAEEMFFRGFLFHGLWARIGFWPAALASGLLFALIHVSSSEYIGLIIPFTIIGTLFAWLVARTGSLWNAVAVHFLFNAAGVTANFAQVVIV